MAVIDGAENEATFFVTRGYLYYVNGTYLYEKLFYCAYNSLGTYYTTTLFPFREKMKVRNNRTNLRGV